MNAFRRRRRSGTILIAVLACLVVAVSLVFAGVQSLVRARRECKDVRLIRQTRLLVDAGVSRAIERLSKSKDYQGEIWHPKIAMDETWKPVVVIREEQPSNQANPQERKFSVVAKLESNAHPMQTTQKSFQFSVNVPEP